MAARLHPAAAPFQRHLQLHQDGQEHGIVFPLLLVPFDSSTDVTSTLAAASRLATRPASSPSRLRQLLDVHGAVQFKRLPLRTPEDFSDFGFALAGQGSGSWRPHLDHGLPVPRRHCARNVSTVNEGSRAESIPAHHEHANSPRHPTYVLLFCLSPPSLGGETPIVSSVALYDRLSRSHPKFLEALKTKGVAYTVDHAPEPNGQRAGASGIYAPSAFGRVGGADICQLGRAEPREVVEDNIRNLAKAGGWREGLGGEAPEWQKKGFEWQWRDDGSVGVIHRVPGVRLHPTLGQPVFFNSVNDRYRWVNLHGALDPLRVCVGENAGATGRPPPQLVGPSGGEPIPREWCKAVARLQAELAADVTWEVGDVLVIDNFAVQHGGKPWRGDRRLLISLWDEPGLEAQPLA